MLHRRDAGFKPDAQAGRGPNMITAMPARHGAAPGRSQRLSLIWSAHRSHRYRR